MIKHDRINIGRTPSCLLFSWRTQTPCILDSDIVYHRCDPQFEDVDFSEFSASSPDEMLANLCFAMSFTGLLLHPSNVQSVRVEDGLQLITKNNRKIVYQAEPVFFDGKKKKLFDVYDEFHWRRGGQHDTKVLHSRERFCRKISFYPSLRPRVRAEVKDLTVCSIMNEEEILSPNYGNGVARIKALRMMDKAGLKGQLGMVRNGKQYYKRIKIEFHSRKVIPRFSQTMTFKEAYDMEQQREKEWKTFEKLKFR